MTRPPLVLASGSPRRRQLLAQIGVAFSIASQDIDETQAVNEPPEDYVRRMAREKAQAALATPAVAADQVVLAADTVVMWDGEVMPKPEDRNHAVVILAKLSGTSHRVLTAVTVADRRRERSLCSDSLVEFRMITRDEAGRYWDSGEPEDKAGAYAIQGLGAVFVKSLSGSYSGVVGLPLYETATLLDEFGIVKG